MVNYLHSSVLNMVLHDIPIIIIIIIIFQIHSDITKQNNSTVHWWQ